MVVKKSLVCSRKPSHIIYLCQVFKSKFPNNGYKIVKDSQRYVFCLGTHPVKNPSLKLLVYCLHKALSIEAPLTLAFYWNARKSTTFNYAYTHLNRRYLSYAQQKTRLLIKIVQFFSLPLKSNLLPSMVVLLALDCSWTPVVYKNLFLTAPINYWELKGASLTLLSRDWPRL